LWDFLLYCFYK